ncbi:MAG: low molecular weight phosphotyrosine protein phosphatase [Bacteroides sp.]|nr:low molecular weight phosphotyrosine protein phosphatase [Bacillota bacterium]MCM1393881.1 low molecular weight phosphotyrosine protein phosphatase [[Eubacterium] siraeum]MCM1455766.1 low molecular weight phosphotyrosine protein phosphatase [Bacteroides sp.]
MFSDFVFSSAARERRKLRFVIKIIQLGGELVKLVAIWGGRVLYFLKRLWRAKMLRVMFVCLGNICRSAMAECVMTRLVNECGLCDEFIIDSAGTSDEEQGNGIYPPAERKLRAEGIEILPHRAKRLKASDYDRFDLFLCAEQSNVASAKYIFGGDREGKVFRMLDLSKNPRNIADPWWTRDYDIAYNDILEACKSLLGYATANGYIRRGK